MSSLFSLIALSLPKIPKALKSLAIYFGRPQCRGMLSLLLELFSWLACRFCGRAELDLGVIALRHQLAVLRRQRSGRTQLFAIDRLIWAWLYRVWPRFLNVLVVVKPATVIQWHRQGFRLYWRWRLKSGRPSIYRELRDVIWQMSEAKSTLGVRHASTAS